MSLVLEAFAGPGGWSEALRQAGFSGTAVGVEHDMSACRTATAAGHLRICADVATYPLEHLAGRVDGVIQSPPCTTFSNAGHGMGRQLVEVLATAMTRMARGGHVLAATRRKCARILRRIALEKFPKHTRQWRSRWAREQAFLSALVLQPLRWVLALRPRWVALEQVPAVAPLWTHLAVLLRELGYSAWTGVLSAEEYGVPQTRKRAILTASLDRRVMRPTPTHQPYRVGRVAETEPDLFGDPLPPPVSMADALGWGLPERPAWTVTSGGAETGGAEVFGNAKNRKHLAEIVRMAPAGASSKMVEPRPAPAPAHTITGKGTAEWVFSNGPEANATERGLDEPAATVYSQRSGNLNWKLRNGNQDNACERRACEPAGTLFFSARTNAVDWVYTRPATTVCGDARIAPPGHRDREGGERQFTEETWRVTVQEAAILQSFPPDYPWQGAKSQQYQQVGNAVPPLLGAAILRPLIQQSEERAA